MSNPFTGNVVADTTYFYANGVLKSDSLYNPATGTGSGHIEFDPNAQWLDSLNKRRSDITDYIRTWPSIKPCSSIANVQPTV
jgi:hypothetical protein